MVMITMMIMVTIIMVIMTMIMTMKDMIMIVMTNSAEGQRELRMTFKANAI